VDQTAAEEYYLLSGHVFASDSPCLIRTVLGSCIGVCLHDRRTLSGGMNHFVFPRPGRNDQPTAQYGEPVIRALYILLRELGSRREDLVSRVIGGAYLKDNEESRMISGLNVRVALDTLHKMRLPIVFEDTGGTTGRKVLYFTATDRLIIERIEPFATRDFYDHKGLSA
jgi:chemotaxis protein CheD